MALTEAGERYLARFVVLLDELDRAGDESRAAVPALSGRFVSPPLWHLAMRASCR
jgi:DNA-binding transcriptional LysR family regulator